ncbi:MAG: 3-deoxy-manno-octulosonate cytidylyltransferase [Gammaproteobacteria bacterium]|jgi:3-deoxy-manno-octulosonate cytidylyltransferase (CMP-KDO synthetase)|nr:3-deoxy-manno-octulosonate cytidylyltransferase [Gammaproteobacteria bacterium]
MVAFKVVIPSRYASTRLPAKPLADIGGRPMIRHVWERGVRSGADEVVIACDDERIAEAARGFGAVVCLTSPQHRSGTDRITEVADVLGWTDDTLVVNLQGDEPTMPPQLLHQVADALAAHPDASVATLSVPLAERAALFDPNTVKVVTDCSGYALYFSRAPVPWHRDSFGQAGVALPPDVPFARHLGIYAYRCGFLRRFVSWPPAPLESCESLEQLRVLWQGERIYVETACAAPGTGVDTPEDLERVRRELADRG